MKLVGERFGSDHCMWLEALRKGNWVLRYLNCGREYVAFKEMIASELSFRQAQLIFCLWQALGGRQSE
jgi:hypothetical protein